MKIQGCACLSACQRWFATDRLQHSVLLKDQKHLLHQPTQGICTLTEWVMCKHSDYKLSDSAITSSLGCLAHACIGRRSPVPAQGNRLCFIHIALYYQPLTFYLNLVIHSQLCILYLTCPRAGLNHLSSSSPSSTSIARASSVYDRPTVTAVHPNMHACTAQASQLYVDQATTG